MSDVVVLSVAVNDEAVHSRGPKHGGWGHLSRVRGLVTADSRLLPAVCR